MSDDPSDVRIQEEIIEEARQNNIKFLDTARHYVCNLLASTPTHV